MSCVCGVEFSIKIAQRGVKLDRGCKTCEIATVSCEYDISCDITPACAVTGHLYRRE